jgi:hypothetical protein
MSVMIVTVSMVIVIMTSMRVIMRMLSFSMSYYSYR